MALSTDQAQRGQLPGHDVLVHVADSEAPLRFLIIVGKRSVTDAHPDRRRHVQGEHSDVHGSGLLELRDHSAGGFDAFDARLGRTP